MWLSASPHVVQHWLRWYLNDLMRCSNRFIMHIYKRWNRSSEGPSDWLKVINYLGIEEFVCFIWSIFKHLSILFINKRYAQLPVIVLGLNLVFLRIFLFQLRNHNLFRSLFLWDWCPWGLCLSSFPQIHLSIMGAESHLHSGIWERQLEYTSQPRPSSWHCCPVCMWDWLGHFSVGRHVLRHAGGVRNV